MEQEMSGNVIIGHMLKRLAENPVGKTLSPEARQHAALTAAKAWAKISVHTDDAVQIGINEATANVMMYV